ncbi:class C beta-lactamase-related serine hydrolase [Candidatus Paraluminiphilus aquimaris]|jgi:CubicO group peptidase (beta-lactamase class C family)|uniref:Class C beta-lactamase-related serine hydrolase n=1 Tax=Candidatus Paraluminiphilus aquimaris TaxID=2518994 RepID=A0ABY6Q4S3_9GAMM|nr:serine hydrolase [Candidatus Paraluminiphilus aquimaris]UZP73520.1 class C beta-lactamase-related serine hydrolase [Candidatus Paraluminiphilus aquimaris]
MRRIALALGSLIIAAFFWALHSAASIGVGYSAKQLCSGVFVSQLPAEFILEKDILPRMATVAGMDRFVDAHVGEREATVNILTASATARYKERYGCTLHGDAQALTESEGGGDRIQPAVRYRSDNPLIEQAVDALFTESDEGGRNTLAVLVMHKGEIVTERYAAPVDSRTRLQGWSMNKSLMASFVGVQVGRGLMDLSWPVKARMQALGATADVTQNVSADLTLKHLMTMASGLDFDERYLPGDDVTQMLYGGVPMWQVPLAQGQRVDPGEEFVYSSGDTNVVSYLWQSTLDDEPYVDWIDREVNQRLGLDDPLLEPDISGVQVGSSFAYLTARDWARFGQWWLDAWHGRDALLSQEWQRLAVTPSETADFYGLSFWLNTRLSDYPDLPANTFHAGGNSGQFVVVVPEAELVMVRLGLTLNESAVGLAQPFASIYQALSAQADLAVNVDQ